MQIVLTAVNEAMAQAWEQFCGNLPGVAVHHGSILDVACDAVVSPANSFGFMDGGVDALYLDWFGADLQERVQKMIAERHHGELLVGNADIVETNHADVPWLIVAPTMRVPMRLVDSINPFLAARAVFLLVQQGVFAEGLYQGQPICNVVRRIALPGLGTGVGGVSPNICVQQVRMAMDEVLFGKRCAIPFGEGNC